MIGCFWTALNGAFWSSLLLWVVLSANHYHTALLFLCFLTVGIRASGFSIPLSLLMLLGLSLMKSRLRSSTLRAYKWISDDQWTLLYLITQLSCASATACVSQSLRISLAKQTTGQHRENPAMLCLLALLAIWIWSRSIYIMIFTDNPPIYLMTGSSSVLCTTLWAVGSSAYIERRTAEQIIW